MSWGCPHQINEEYCKRLSRPCHPGSSGCVLSGTVTDLMSSQGVAGGSQTLDRPAMRTAEGKRAYGFAAKS